MGSLCRGARAIGRGLAYARAAHRPTPIPVLFKAASVLIPVPVLNRTLSKSMLHWGVAAEVHEAEAEVDGVAQAHDRGVMHALQLGQLRPERRIRREHVAVYLKRQGGRGI